MNPPLGDRLGLLYLLACPAEQLGIELPPAGADAISHEDLRRDTRLLTAGDAGAAFVERLGQMQMVPSPAPTVMPEGTVCASRGEGAPPEGKPRLLLVGRPTNADEATAAAALISIAKAWDLGGGPIGKATLCMLPGRDAPPPSDASALSVAAIASGDLRWSPGTVGADAAEPARPAERINYTDLQARTKAIFLRL